MENLLIPGRGEIGKPYINSLSGYFISTYNHIIYKLIYSHNEKNVDEGSEKRFKELQLI